MINFSRYKLQEGVAASSGAQASIDASTKSSESSVMGRDKATNDKQLGSERQRRQRAQKADPRGVGQVFEDMQRKVERIKAFESQKSDWRTELNEKVADGQEREQHPYVTVMPTGDENLINAMKQMGKGVKDKKDAMKAENYDTQFQQKSVMDKDKDMDDSEAEKQKKKAKKAKMMKEEEEKEESPQEKAEIERKGKEYRKNHEILKRSAKKSYKLKKNRLSKLRKGDVQGAQRDKDAADKESSKAREAEAKNSDLDPVGSNRYTDENRPERGNKNFDKAVKTDKGAADIVRSTLKKDAGWKFNKIKNKRTDKVEGFAPEGEMLTEKKKKKCKEGYKRDENGNCVKKSTNEDRPLFMVVVMVMVIIMTTMKMTTVTTTVQMVVVMSAVETVVAEWVRCLMFSVICYSKRNLSLVLPTTLV